MQRTRRNLLVGKGTVREVLSRTVVSWRSCGLWCGSTGLVVGMKRSRGMLLVLVDVLTVVLLCALLLVSLASVLWVS